MSDEPDDEKDLDDDEIEHDDSEGGGARALERLFAADGPADLDEGMFAGPLHWPSIPAADGLTRPIMCTN